MSKIEKKYNTNLNIRIEDDLKKKFIEITEKQDVKFSHVIRNFIKDYITKYGAWLSITHELKSSGLVVTQKPLLTSLSALKQSTTLPKNI